jgi:hypothetical protein
MLLYEIGFEVETGWFVEVFLFLQTLQLTSLRSVPWAWKISGTWDWKRKKWLVNVLSWMLNTGLGSGVWNEVRWKEVIACITQPVSVFWVNISRASHSFCSVCGGWGRRWIFAYCDFCFMKLGTMFNDVLFHHIQHSF